LPSPKERVFGHPFPSGKGWGWGCFFKMNDNKKQQNMEKKQNKKAVAFIDYANIKAWARDKGLNIDMEVLIEMLNSVGIEEVRFYYGKDERNSNYLIKALKQNFKKVIVVSGRKSLSGFLFKEADKFVTMERIASIIPEILLNQNQGRKSDINAKPALRQVLKKCAPSIASLLGLSSGNVDNKLRD